jgi:peptide chain release factor 2
MASPGFWDVPEKSQATVAELKRVQALLKPFAELNGAADDLNALVELADEDTTGHAEQELRREVPRIEQLLHAMELRALLSDPDDASNAYLSVQAGEGGTEACDWANMLLRMYLRWAEAHDYETELLEVSGGEEAGIRSATVAVRGPLAYGYLKGEIGVHRLVRISPFDARGRRHTSFAAVDVIPEVDENIEIDIREEDLRIDTYRAGGAGGQHVNKTSSAVRITHEPTGIVVQCQNERSQHQNRRMAMAMLKARLRRLELDKRDAERERKYDEKGEIGFGSRIRSYVLQPYRQVKDERTGVEIGNVDAVLDGDLDRLIDAYLRHRAGAKAAT